MFTYYLYLTNFVFTYYMHYTCVYFLILPTWYI